MSSDMNLSSLLQSELYCTPTQVVLIDAILESDFVSNLLESLCVSESDFIDHIKVKDYISRADRDLNATDKAQYVKYRVPLLSTLLSLFERRLAIGTKERCVIIVIGNVEDPIAHTCLLEMPLDVSNLIFWKTGHLPGVFRMATTLDSDMSKSSSNAHMKAFKSLLDCMREQYFEMPRFEGETTTKRSSGDINGATVSSIRPSNSHLLCVNPYDILVCSSTLTPLERFFREILPLQQLEASYASQHMSSLYGSGGSLYLVEGRLVSSVSGWRRADWLVLAQSLFLPRLWCLDDKKILDEFTDLFKYRHWVSRFDGLEETDQSNLEIIAFPDSDRKTIKKALKNIASMNLQRRKRESGWEYAATRLDSLSAIKLKASAPQSKSVAMKSLPSKSSSSKRLFDPLLHEKNPYRITESHFEVFRELVSFLNREEKFSESLKVIRKYVRASGSGSSHAVGVDDQFDSHSSTRTSPSKTHRPNSSRTLNPTKRRGHSKMQLLAGTAKCPAEFDKLEGISLLGAGNKEEAIRMLERYRDHLEGEEQDRRLLLSQKGDEKEQAERNRQSARVWGEVSGIYSACGNFKSAQLMAGKALELDSTLTAAQKTLVLAVGRTGESSFQEEDWIFSFFATAKTVQMEEAASFYAKRTEKFPNNGYFWYGYAMLNFVIGRDFEQTSEPLFQRALELLPNEGRITEAYATYLFQTRSPQILRIKDLYASSMRLDPSNLVLRANSAAFLLFLRSAQLSRLDDGVVQYGDCEAPEVYPVKEYVLVSETREAVMDGFDEAQNFLESALFSVSLVDQHPQVYLECWFYVLCYTMERARATQALQYIKAALRKGIRARNWDMHMHIRFLRRNALFNEIDTCWVPKLATVIADRQALDILDDWKLWCSLKSDKLVLNLKLAPHSFRVCVSPSKRREQKEEFTPPRFFKTKSAPLASMVSLNSPTLSKSRSRAKQTASSPFNAKPRTTRKFISTPTESSSAAQQSVNPIIEEKSKSKSPSNGNTVGLGPILKSAPEVTRTRNSSSSSSIGPKSSVIVSESKSTPTRSMQVDTEDDILNLLSTHASSLSTPPATEYSSIPPSSAEIAPRRTINRGSAGEKGPKRQTGALTSSAGSVLFSGGILASSVAPIRKTKSPPLSASSAKNTAKSVNSRTSRSRSNSPSIASDQMGVSQNDQVWERLVDKYKVEDDDILNSLSTSSSSRTIHSSRSSIQLNATEAITRPNSTDPVSNFSETVPKRPTRSASGGIPAPKRTRRI